MVERRASLRLPVNGESVLVPLALHLRCPKCGEVLLRSSDSRALSGAANANYRRRHRLLGSEEIRGIRDRLGLTQAQLARLLRLGSNTVSRWEAGRNVQTAAMDVLLRLIRDVPGNLAYLRRRAA